ncbi:MAG TPA: HK97 family phage prohead protease [Candidatus Dormibacteraeota bacterium]|jgi:HK97 family phage prohead protease|nr:HK97 family phage prohead protease [Candidatus Dormibacteraeota bacterium]
MINERRILKCPVRATRSQRSDSVGLLTGYAAKYNIMSKDLGGFRERIASGAFERILSTNPDTVCLVQHNPNLILGRTTSGTLRLRSDFTGLYFECDVPNTQAGRDTYESVQRGDIDECSFSFLLGHDMDSWEQDNIGPVRTLRDFKQLADVSVVINPAYPGTEVDAREEELVAAEVRSHVAALKDPTRWRKHPIWRSACKNSGVDPDTASLRGLVTAIEQGQRRDEQTVVARRRAIINDLIL